MTVMLALTIIPVTTASDNKKGYFHGGIALPLFVIDLFFLAIKRTTLFFLLFIFILISYYYQGLLYGKQGRLVVLRLQDYLCAGSLCVLLWVAAFGQKKDKGNGKHSQKCIRFKRLVFIVNGI